MSYGEGKKEAASKLMRTAADLEDGSEKHVAMENRLWPMRELLGDMLLAANEPAPGPEGVRSLFAVGAQSVPRFLRRRESRASAPGTRKKRALTTGSFWTLCSSADAQRPELAEAKKYLAQK